MLVLACMHCARERCPLARCVEFKFGSVFLMMVPSVPDAPSIAIGGRPAMQARGPSTTLNSPDGGASMKPPTAVAPAGNAGLEVSRTPCDNVMGAAVRDSTSIAKGQCSGRFIGGSNGLHSSVERPEPLDHVGRVEKRDNVSLIEPLRYVPEPQPSAERCVGHADAAGYPFADHPPSTIDNVDSSPDHVGVPPQIQQLAHGCQAVTHASCLLNLTVDHVDALGDGLTAYPTFQSPHQEPLHDGDDQELSSHHT